MLPRRKKPSGSTKPERAKKSTTAAGPSIDAKLDTAKQCRRRIEAFDDTDARRIERAKEVPGDDHESCKSTQRFELHDLAVSGRRCAGYSVAAARDMLQ